MSTRIELSTLSMMVLAIVFVGLAVIVPNQLQREAPSASDQHEFAYEYVEAPDAADRTYDAEASSNRPLFLKSRRMGPVELSNDTTADLVLSASNVKVEAIVGGPSGFSAGLRLAEQDNLSWVRAGQRIHNWKVIAVREDSVRLQKGEQTMELTLYPKRQRIAGE